MDFQITYIMVANWNNHWDKLRNDSSIFTTGYIKDNLADGSWPSEAVTLFIKQNKENQFEKSWIGKTTNFRSDITVNGNSGIRFDVQELEEIECPTSCKEYEIGWHLNKIPFLVPYFFFQIEDSEWLQFEEYSFQLLRLLGIHEIRKFPQSDNRGKADGFFKLNVLSVLYDVTLEDNFEDSKATQIDNYISQLKGDKIRIGHQVYTIHDTTRQVWIITKGTHVRSIKREDHIKVKEVPYSKLIEIYTKRLTNDIGLEELEALLKDLH